METMRIFEDMSVEEAVRARRSVRTYDGRPVEEALRAGISAYMEKLWTPFGAEVEFRLLESTEPLNGAKLGTYGIIRGATSYIGVSVGKGEAAVLSAGYAFEELLLYITTLGLGTCWMGGTFKRSEFAKAMAIGDDRLFPAISPFGHGAQKRSIPDALVRYVAKGDQRKAWEELFFDEDFGTPLSRLDTGAYETVLEMVRLAPSASNKQPWRVVRRGRCFHFYLARTPGYGEALGYDIQLLDMGIAACHFQLAAKEKGLAGRIGTGEHGIYSLPKDTRYVFSWTMG